MKEKLNRIRKRGLGTGKKKKKQVRDRLIRKG